MRLTIEIKDTVLDDLLQLTGATKRSPAVAQAVEDFVRRQKMKDLGRLIREGAFADAIDSAYDPDSPTVFAGAGDTSAPQASAWVLAEDKVAYGTSPKKPASKTKRKK